MQGISKAGKQLCSVGDCQETTITSEEEFERWLIAALEWERQRLQNCDSSGSRPAIASTSSHA
jgi:hypothetical protein